MMSKRRISKQQTTRIETLQAHYRNNNETQDQLNNTGLVISRYSKHAEVETSSGNLIHCSIRPNIDSLVAGDQVIWQQNAHNSAVIVSRFPRKTTLARSTKRNEKVVAANVTQLIIVTAVKPEISWLLLDSYLVAAENLGLKAIILLNKTDLPCEELKDELLCIYENINYPVIFTSAKDISTYDSLKSMLNEEVSVIVGQSGVGKSSIIAKILPEETIAVAEISSLSELGCHTTSVSRYYHLPNGGALIDSPGVREFGLGQVSASEVVYGFREFKDLIKQCKFRNCDHSTSPGCALTVAVEANNKLLKRYDSFLKLITKE